MSEPRGMFSRATLPSLQLPFPEALVVTRLTTHVLVAGLFGFGIGSGGPKRHPSLPGYSGFVIPAAVQLRLLPVSVSVVVAPTMVVDVVPTMVVVVTGFVGHVQSS